MRFSLLPPSPATPGPRGHGNAWNRRDVLMRPSDPRGSRARIDNGGMLWDALDARSLVLRRTWIRRRMRSVTGALGSEPPAVEESKADAPRAVWSGRGRLRPPAGAIPGRRQPREGGTPRQNLMQDAVATDARRAALGLALYAPWNTPRTMRARSGGRDSFDVASAIGRDSARHRILVPA